jgi:NAD(P)-dependent dehydrogenase (short-subunit alcohol dehydrogenase family)
MSCVRAELAHEHRDLGRREEASVSGDIILSRPAPTVPIRARENNLFPPMSFTGCAGPYRRGGPSTVNRERIIAMLDDKVAVIYGAGGAIGGAVARAFAREGARVFVTGRVAEPVAALAREIGGGAEAAAVDALDEAAIERHLSGVIEVAGRLDISFNAIGIPDATILGGSLLDIEARRYALPIENYTLSYFLTARLAARRMIRQKSGVIMTVSALPARTGVSGNGGYGPAMAAKEAMTRDLSAELAPQGIRVVNLRPHGMPETKTMHEVHETKMAGMPYAQFEGFLAGSTHRKRAMRLDEVAEVAAFVASDRASGLTGTTVNLTMGSLDD